MNSSKDFRVSVKAYSVEGHTLVKFFDRGGEPTRFSCPQCDWTEDLKLASPDASDAFLEECREINCPYCKTNLGLLAN